MSIKGKASILAGIALLGACTTLPTGPSVLVLPGSGRSFDQFRADDMTCRQYAMEQIGGTSAGQRAGDSMARSAAVGTAVGAVAGAAIGGDQGAGVGAGTGLMFGTMAGASAADSSSYGTQRRYDYAFIQCMYAKGHRVPVYGQMSTTPIPPPPAGSPPPPPPR